MGGSCARIVGAPPTLGGAPDLDTLRTSGSNSKETRAENARKKAFVPSLPPPRYTTSVRARIFTSSSLKYERRISDKSCLVTIDTGASVTLTLKTSALRWGTAARDPPDEE